MRTNMTSSGARLLAATMLATSLGLIGSCDTFNPFNPIAFVEVTEVSHTGATSTTGGGATTAGQGAGVSQNLNTAGILQTFQTDAQGNPTNQPPFYTQDDPVVSLRNRASAPEVRFRSVVVVFDIANIQIPQKEFLFQFLLPQGVGQAAGATTTTSDAGTPRTVPIVSLFFDELSKAIFPNNSFPIVRSGSAHVFLKGVDRNDHDIVIDFTTPLTFKSAFNQQGATGAATTPTTGATPAAIAPSAAATPPTTPVAAATPPASPAPSPS